MKFCETCKEQFAGHLNFCPRCRNKSEDTSASMVASSEEIQRETRPVRSKKNIFLFIGFIVIAALLFGVYQFGAYKFSKEKQVNEMLEAFQKTMLVQ